MPDGRAGCVVIPQNKKFIAGKKKSLFHANIAPMKFDHVVLMDKFNLILLDLG